MDVHEALATALQAEDARSDPAFAAATDRPTSAVASVSLDAMAARGFRAVRRGLEDQPGLAGPCAVVRGARVAGAGAKSKKAPSTALTQLYVALHQRKKVPTTCTKSRKWKCTHHNLHSNSR